MTKLECLELLEDVRSDYVATLRDNHGLKKLKSTFDPASFQIVRRLDQGIRDMKQATYGEHRQRSL